MSPSLKPITIKISHRPEVSVGEPEDRRSAFWEPLKKSDSRTNFGKKKTSELEGKLEREFGDKLSDFLTSRDEQDRPRSETPTLVFKAKVSEYSNPSLIVDLLSNIEKVAPLLGLDPDSFKLLLDVCVPIAFADVFTQDFADKMEYNIDIPPSIREALSDVKPATVREKVQKLKETRLFWAIADRSWIIPVALALYIMFIAWQEMSALRASQAQEFKSIIEYQMKILEEDSERLKFLFENLTVKPPVEPSTPSNNSSVCPSATSLPHFVGIPIPACGCCEYSSDNRICPTTTRPADHTQADPCPLEPSK